MLPETRGGASGSALPASGLADPSTQLAALISGVISKGHRNDEGTRTDSEQLRGAPGDICWGSACRSRLWEEGLWSLALGWVCCACIYTKVPLSNSSISASLHTSACKRQQMGWVPREQPGTKFRSAHNHHEITSENSSTTPYHQQPVFCSELQKQRAAQGSCALLLLKQETLGPRAKPAFGFGRTK